MKIKTFEEWWSELDQDVLNADRKYVWSEPLPATVQSTGSTHFSMHKETAKRWYSQIVDSEAEPEPQRPRCRIMRRFAKQDDTPLGCYEPVAWCEDYHMFEELLKGAKLEHGLICIQEQAAADDAKPTGKSYPSVDAMLADMGMHETRAKVLQLEVDELKAELAKLKKPEPEPAAEEGPFVLLLIFKGEQPHYRGTFESREEAKQWADDDGAFSPPGVREYKILTEKEWNEHLAKTAAPSNETPPAPDPS